MQPTDLASGPSPLLSGESPFRRPVSAMTLIGLFISLFGILVIRQTALFFWPTQTVTGAIWKESLIWLSAFILLVLVRRGEGLPLRSIGLGTSLWWKSILWGLVIATICGVVGAVLAHLTQTGSAPDALQKLPLWLFTLIVVRAGIVEELFYRGYAIERLQMLGLGRFWAASIPLVIFALSHWTGGWTNIVIALALGGVLTGFYLWRRDLVSNMFGHFLVDFVANILPKLFS